MKGSMLFLIAIIVVVLLVEYYCYIALASSIATWSKSKRSWTITIYAALSIAGWIMLFWIRYMSGIDFPQNVKAVMMASLFGMVLGKVIIAVFMLLGDVFNGFQWIFRQISINKTNTSIDVVAVNQISRSSFLSRVALLAGGMMFGTFVWGTTNRYRYQIKKIKLNIPNLPDALKGLKIVQISDVHSGSFDNKAAVSHGIDLVLEQNPDIIFFTGDIVNDRSSELTPYLDIFGRLKAPLGVYSTLGNHDYGDYASWPSPEAKVENLNTLKQYHADMGWKLMMNEHVILNKNGAEFALLGVENWSASSRFPKKGNLKQAYAGLENKALPLKILLSHDPSHWDAEVRPNYMDIDLTLSGHTHGMQFGIELPWMKWSPAEYVYKQWAGLYSENKQHLYVNRGFGFLGYQGRIGILPEITVIELA